MTIYSKPAVRKAWGESNTTSADQFDPGDTATGVGWVASTTTPPSRQRFNWVLYWLANGIRYFMQRGLADWDAAETYGIGAFIVGSDNNAYRSVITSNTGNDPTTSGLTKWERISWSQANLDARYLQLSNVATASVAFATNSTNAVNATNASFATNASTAAAAPWSGITSKPTTVSGYAISDAVTTTGSQTITGFITIANGDLRAYRSGGTTGYLNFGTGSHYIAFDGSNYVAGGNTILDAGNYSTYTVTKTGSGASGTWGINITGNAATATNSTTQAAGTSDTTIATTAFACPGFSHGTNGYDKRPSGLIEQWGVVFLGDIPAQPSLFSGTITFPTSFSSAVYAITVSIKDVNNLASGVASTNAWSTSNFTYRVGEYRGEVQDVTLVWTAIGK